MNVSLHDQHGKVSEREMEIAVSFLERDPYVRMVIVAFFHESALYVELAIVASFHEKALRGVLSLSFGSSSDGSLLCIGLSSIVGTEGGVGLEGLTRLSCFTGKLSLGNDCSVSVAFGCSWEPVAFGEGSRIPAMIPDIKLSIVNGFLSRVDG